MPADKGTSWFFGIGINQYEAFPRLNNAVKDVEDILALLQEKYDVNPGHILLLQDKEATRENIIIHFDHLKKQVQAVDKLIIYYSGHGHLDENARKGYWIPTDAQKDHTANYIRNSTIRDYIEEIQCRHILLISDSCFSGTLFVRGSQRSTKHLDELEQHISRWALCSGRHDEEVYDGKPGENSPFASSILAILRRNNEPKLNVAKLADEVVELTRASYKQLPEGNPLFGVGHQGGQYIFRLKGYEDKQSTALSRSHVEARTAPEPAIRSSIGISKGDRKNIFRWWGIVLGCIVLAFGLFAVLGNSAVDMLIEPLVPLVFFPIPFVAIYFAPLSRRSAWVSTGTYGVFFNGFLFLWIRGYGQSAWWLLPALALGGVLYYFLIPRLNQEEV